MSSNTRIFRTPEFEKWFGAQTEKVQTIVEARLDRIILFDHFGLIRRFDGIIELKWKSGLRIYLGPIDNSGLLALLGGNKNGQDKDIKKAKSILAAYT